MDRVLTLNVGSSSLKWTLFDERDVRIDGATESLDEKNIVRMLSAVSLRIGDVDCVAHRVVHGGNLFRTPRVIDRRARERLDTLIELDPLHMRPALRALDAARICWPDALHVAAFDTAFHATLSEEASTYAVPLEWREKYGVRRYGFHGLSVEYAIRRVHEIMPHVVRRALVLHLGSGASATAVLDGRSVDTTMGMTPLEGMVMSTRTGSIDPGAILHLLNAGLTPAAIEEGLARKGGLFALAGEKDMRTLARATDSASRFARAQFVRSVAKHACSLLPALGGLDAIVFTGGIGEGDAALRELVTSSLRFTGIKLDPAANQRNGDDDRVVSSSSSAVVAFVIHAREDVMLLRAARQASCTGERHATSETHSRRDRLQ